MGNSRRPQTVAGSFQWHEILRMLFTNESFFFRGGDDFAVDYQRGRSIMIERAG